MKEIHVSICLKNSIEALDITADSFLPCLQQFPHWHFDFYESHEALYDALATTDFAVVWKFPLELYTQSPCLKAVFTPAAGHDWVPDDPTGSVPVFHGSFHGMLMSESLLAALLYFNARLPFYIRSQKERLWEPNAAPPARTLRQQHILFVGYGAIGRYCARLIKPFGCTMSGIQRTHEKGYDPETGVRYCTMDALEDELAMADHIVLILPGNTETRGIITKTHLCRVKTGACLYNIGRGSVIAESDIIEALDTGILGGAALDVFEQEPLPSSSPLWDHPRVLISPHASAHYREYGHYFVDELIARLAQFDR